MASLTTLWALAALILLCLVILVTMALMIRSRGRLTHRSDGDARPETVDPWEASARRMDDPADDPQ